MEQLEQHIIRVNEKLQKLLRLYQGLQRENARMKQELVHKKGIEKELTDKCTRLQQQLEIARVAANGYDRADAASKGDLEKRINGYLKEIDECIALLSNQ